MTEWAGLKLTKGGAKGGVVRVSRVGGAWWAESSTRCGLVMGVCKSCDLLNPPFSKSLSTAGEVAPQALLIHYAYG